jgi:hypothetical protein
MIVQLTENHVRFMIEQPEIFTLFQNRLAAGTRNPDREAVDQQVQRYLGEVEKALAPLLPAGVPATAARGIVCALFGFTTGYLAIARIGMKRDDLTASLDSLRRAVIAGAGGFSELKSAAT